MRIDIIVGVIAVLFFPNNVTAPPRKKMSSQCKSIALGTHEREDFLLQLFLQFLQIFFLDGIFVHVTTQRRKTIVTLLLRENLISQKSNGTVKSLGIAEAHECDGMRRTYL